MRSILFSLTEKSPESPMAVISGKIRVDHDGISIQFNGYGTKVASDSEGEPVYIEMWEGSLRVVIWDNINVEDPIIISLDKSRVDLLEGE